ncbi:unnamed protein product [Hyaloperonospora brassicae]|uniref:Uncharacterized protein n=1 Tax=Hyaloperonospora brassicae TaxID=162125 RepID=A0AAV0UI58_HYABA|nr:unnamed protein product [Hyaloperonospora brassicae]
MTTATRAPSWRVRERHGPRRSRRALVWHTLSASDQHPLATGHVDAAGTDVLGGACASFRRQELGPEAPRATNASRALVDVQKGDAAPLEALLSAVAIGTLRLERSDVTVEPTTGVVQTAPRRDLSVAASVPRTVKTEWKAQAREEMLASWVQGRCKTEARLRDVTEQKPGSALGRRSDCFSTEKMDEEAATVTVIERTRARLRQLECGRATEPLDDAELLVSAGHEQDLDMSQKQYVAKVKGMQKHLIDTWEQHRKVEALRIAIKCVKLLADTTTAPRLYPCVFVLVTDVLDAFGKLVYDRIDAQASEDESGQPPLESMGDHVRSSNINVQAIETCRNWFYKSACIRELLPRMGVGDPMVALYARVYLSLASSEVLGVTSPAEQTAVVSSSLFDYFYAFHWFRHNKLEQWLLANKMRYEEYLALHSPAVEWIVKCIAPGATQDTFDSLLAHYREYVGNPMVLKPICKCFGAQFYAATPTVMLDLIRAASPSFVSKCHLYSTVATQLSKVPRIAGDEPGGKLQFLNSSWSSITSQEDIAQYMECAAAYMKLIVTHFSHREALILLKDVVRHLDAAIPGELTAGSYNLLGALIESVVFGAKQSYEFFSRLIPSPPFLAIMGMFKRESSVDVAKKVLRVFVSGRMKKTSDRSGALRLHIVGPEAAVAHALMAVCCRVHDVLDSLSTASERAEATRDISAFITRLGYVNERATMSERAQGEEQEALLMLYTDCRRAFYKLEQVEMLLSTMVLRLAMYAHRHMRSSAGSNLKSKKHSHVRRGFVQSCLAFAHITIPSSIEAPLEKLQLTVSAANVALVTNCVPQMDALIKAAIVLLADLDLSAVQPAANSDENVQHWSELSGIGSTSSVVDRVVQMIAHLVNVLIYAPSLHDGDAFYFVAALQKAVLERLKWVPRNSPSLSPGLEVGVARVRVSLMLLQVYALWGQHSLPDRLDGVDSNDVLYGGDDTFHNEVQTRFSSMIVEVVHDIEALDRLSGDNDIVDRAVVERVTAAQVELMLDFVNLVAPVLEYGDSRLGTALTMTDPFRGAEAAGPSDGKRRVKSRSAVALIRKCMTYSYEKARLLKQTTPRGTAMHQAQMASTICRYFDSTRVYIADLMLEMSKRAAGICTEVSSQQTVQALVEVLEQYTL